MGINERCMTADLGAAQALQSVSTSPRMCVCVCVGSDDVLCLKRMNRPPPFLSPSGEMALKEQTTKEKTKKCQKSL